jgi:pyruvate-formate lyase
MKSKPKGISNMGIEKLRDELKSFYYKLLPEAQLPPKPDFRHPFETIMDAYDTAHPGLSVYQLKAMQYKIIADNFQPVIFKNSPFYYEMGTKPAQCDGNPWWKHPGGWLLRRNNHLFRDINPEEYDLFYERKNQRIFTGAYVDVDHHCFPISNVIQNGLGKIYEQAAESLKLCTSKEESEFIECVMHGLLAVKKISEKFATTAEAKLKDSSDENEQRFLHMIAQSAREVPWRKPETFYEGLNTLLFLREVSGSLEGVGSTSLGHPDRMLAELYLHDIESGCLTKEDAYDLVCRFLLTGDCRYDKDKQVKEYSDHEMEISFTLGGCDEHGNEVCNDITFMFLKAHHELKLIFPKPFCRFGKNSNPEYLRMINQDILSGRSTLILVNDDCLIPALVRSGKQLEDARCYISTGCWDIIAEGCENAPTGHYIGLPRILEMSIHDCPETNNADIVCEKLDDAENFEEVYERLFGNIISIIRQSCEMIGRNGKVWPQVAPEPLFSAGMADCLKKRKDYTAGGGRYNPHMLSLVGFANIVDSLLVIRELCFETKHHTLSELLTAVRANWKGYERLLAEVLTMPHFGDNNPESDALAQRLHDDIYTQTRDLINERGGNFEIGYWVYREFRYWGEKMRATPDGRRDGDVLSHGINPSRIHHINSITSAINSAATLDLTKCAANSVMNILLPAGRMTTETLDQLERVFATSKIGLLQLHCTSKEKLLDAQKHPEKHQDLIVRVCGFSAKFVALSPEWQEEFINRNIYE